LNLESVQDSGLTPQGTFIRWCNASIKSGNITTFDFADAVQEPSVRPEDKLLACEHCRAWTQLIPETFGTPFEIFEEGEESVEVVEGEFFWILSWVFSF